MACSLFSMKTTPELARPAAPQAAAGTPPPWLEVVRERADGLRFGTIQIVIHEGRVTQVESTERVRFASAESSAR